MDAMATMTHVSDSKAVRSTIGTDPRVLAAPGIESGAVIALIALLMVPSVIWILNDQSVWPWDHARYGDWTLRVWRAKLLGPVGWLNFMIHAVGGTPPLIVWAGQFFVPLRHLTGDFESAILFFNICGATGTLLLVYLTTRRLGAGVFAGLGAVAACGSSQLFIGLTHNYLTEMAQCLSAATMMFVAWHAERRSRIRLFSLTLGAVVLCFLSKASSAQFVLPFLTYIGVALFVARGQPKHPTRASDLALLFIALALTAAAVAWYFVNWAATIGHFLEATSSDIALYYGSAVQIGSKLKFWTSTLGLALSPFSLVAFCMAITIVVAIGIAVARLREMPMRRWAELSVQNGLLFILALTGTVCLTVLAYSLQVNEDTRFILPLIPMIAVLLGWTLSMLRSRALIAIFLIAFAVNAAFVHAYSFRSDPARITPISWLSQLESNPTDKRRLTAGVQATCRPEVADRYNVVGVNYPRLNGNSASFFGQKERYKNGYGCYYLAFGYNEQNVQYALEKITEIGPPYILTVPPDKQFPPDFVNLVSKPLAEFLSHDPRYALVSEIDGYLRIYRKVP
jgi:hypothetical protein